MICGFLIGQIGFKQRSASCNFSVGQSGEKSIERLKTLTQTNSRGDNFNGASTDRVLASPRSLYALRSTGGWHRKVSEDQIILILCTP